MKKNKSMPKFRDEELYGRWIDEIYQNGQIGKYVNLEKPLKGKAGSYSLDYSEDEVENILIGIRLDRRIVNFAKKYSGLRGMTYQSVIKDWIANGYLASMANLRRLKNSR